MNSVLSCRAIFSALSVLLIGSILPACSKNEKATATPSKSVAAPSVSPTSTVEPRATVNALSLDKVQGSWLRTDGGYRLVIGAIGEGGHTKGEYFNPNPIKVAWTRVRHEGSEIKVDVELRDTNYPGCLYKLTYDATQDRLVGTYFQAQMQEIYDIEFVRQP